MDQKYTPQIVEEFLNRKKTHCRSQTNISGFKNNVISTPFCRDWFWRLFYSFSSPQIVQNILKPTGVKSWINPTYHQRAAESMENAAFITVITAQKYFVKNTHIFNEFKNKQMILERHKDVVSGSPNLTMAESTKHLQMPTDRRSFMG